MPCALTKGFSLDCKDVGGIVEIKIKAFSPSSLSDFAPQTDGSVTIAVTSETGWYKYELNKENGTLDEKQTVSVENGTVAYEQTVKFSLYQLAKDKQVELNMLAKNRLWVAVKTQSGTCWLIGYDMGADVTETTRATGKALTDKNGYEVTIVAKSKTYMLDCTTEYDNLTQ